MHIDSGGEVDMDTHFAALPGHLVAVETYRLLILYGTNHLVARVAGCIGQPHGETPLSVEGDEQRYG